MKRRLWTASGSNEASGRFALDVLPYRHPRYIHYVEIALMRTPDGTAFRLYFVEEYTRFADPLAARCYGVVVDERETFWAAAARHLGKIRDEPGDAREIAPLAHATYRNVRGNGLHEYDGRECVVYVVEQRTGRHGLHVPGRCGIRFVGDDSYWVVPAMDLDIGPLATAA
jgi:hypothetical protein